MKKIIKSLLILVSLSTFASPASHVLIPATPKYLSGTSLQVEFTNECIYAPYSSTHVIISSDDTGSMMAGVGVVYSKQRRNCHADGNLHKHIMIVDLKDYGLGDRDFIDYLNEEGGNLFEPLDVESFI